MPSRAIRETDLARPNPCGTRSVPRAGPHDKRNDRVALPDMPIVAAARLPCRLGLEYVT